MALVLTAAAMFTWMERKVSGRMQDRLGPTRVGGRFGWLQTLADGVKLIAKEDLMPGGADALLFRMAPYISFCASFAVYLALPFADGWVGLRLNVAVFFILAVVGLEVFGVILAGYASGSKWSLFGAMREAAQVVSYEVPLGMCVVVPVLIAGTMDLVTIGQMQQGWFTNWLMFHDPFTFIIFWVYFTCAMASVNRGTVRPGRGRKRAGGRLPHRIFRLPLEHVLHGRIRLDVRRQRAGGDLVLRRLERPAADHPLAGTEPASHWAVGSPGVGQSAGHR